MPVISITKKDYGPIKAGWHRFKIKEYVQEPNKAKNGMNHVYTLEAEIDGDKKEQKLWIGVDKEHTRMDFFEAAIDKTVVIGESIQLDPAALTGLEIFGEIVHEIQTEGKYKGKPSASFQAFQPISAPPF